MARVYETFVVLLLLTLLVLGMVWVASAILDQDGASRESLYGELWWGRLFAPYRVIPSTARGDLSLG